MRSFLFSIHNPTLRLLPASVNLIENRARQVSFETSNYYSVRFVLQIRKSDAKASLSWSPHKPFIISPHVPNHTLSSPILRPFSSNKTSSLDSFKGTYPSTYSHQLIIRETTANPTSSLKTHPVKLHSRSRPMSSHSKTDLPPSQSLIPATKPLPPSRSTNATHLTHDFPQYFDFSAYDLPPLTPLALSRDDMAFLIYISSSGEYLLSNGISGTLYLIKRPHPNPSSNSSSVVSILLQAMRDSTLEMVEVDALPEEGEYADAEGWTIYPTRN